METEQGFEEVRTPAVEATAFVVDVEGYEGPIDLLLALAREQKVDLKQISILELADQYLSFIAEVRKANLELAADYLVMAAWLAYLKSRLLIPDIGDDGEPSADEMAAALAFQLQRLEAMREVSVRLMARPRLGRDFFRRGDPEHFVATTTAVFEATLFDLLRAYGDQKRRAEERTLRIPPEAIHSVEEALERFRAMLGGVTDWESLWRFLPPELGEGLSARSAFASTFAASLELAREGHLALRQEQIYGPIYLRAGPRETGNGTEPEDEGD